MQICNLSATLAKIVVHTKHNPRQSASGILERIDRITVTRHTPETTAPMAYTNVLGCTSIESSDRNTAMWVYRSGSQSKVSPESRGRGRAESL
jgi:hypothetical protein